jgi:hypothetical protein
MGRTQAGRPAFSEGIEQARHFDFRLGEWDVTWPGGGSAASSVYVDFDDRVIVESWDGRPSSDLQGMSLTLYDEEAGLWRHTWVDSDGTFDVLAGGFDGDGMELRSEQGDHRQRARWFDVEPDGFSWTLEQSADGGRSWTLVSEVRYSRVL